MTIGVGGSLVSFVTVEVMLTLCDVFVLLKSVFFNAASSFSRLPADPETLELSSAIGTMGIGSVTMIGFDCAGSAAGFGATCWGASAAGCGVTVTVGVLEGTVAT